MAEAKKTTKKTKAEEKTQLEVILKADKAAVEAESEEIVAEAGIETNADSKVTAKAGKRSAKATKEADEKQAKELKKASSTPSEAEKSKANAKPPRTRLERAGKKYQELAKLVDATKTYELAEAIELATKTNPAKFDASVEMHINLGVDPKQADQNVRDTVVLPAGTGKDIRVASISDESDSEKLFAKLDKEVIDFDVLVATPTMMTKLGKYARLLGPRGLMPNPKSGTVTTDVEAAVTEAKAGKVEYRVDQAGIVHLAIGKASFGPQKLQQNADAVLNSIKSAKPSSIKGIYIKSGYITTSMGPSIKFNI